MQKSPIVVWLFGTASVLALAAAGRAQDAGTLRAEQAPPDSLWVDRLNLSLITQEYGKPQAGKSVDGNPLRLGGITYAHGIGTHARSDMAIDLHGAALRFAAMVGLDDERAGKGSVTFTLIVDGKKVAVSPVLHGGDPPRMLAADLTDAKRLILRVGDGNDGITNDHADWAGALLTLKPGATERPEAIAPPPVPVVPPRIVMLPPDPAPAIHGPRIVGTTPWRPFLFRIAATGEGPLTFEARRLPDGLSLDSRTGIITGALKNSGRTEVGLTVRGPRGKAERGLTIVGGDHKLALTPPMGWNSWNVWAGAVDQQKVKASADAMLKSGLAAHGYEYVNIDDTWEGGRDAQGRIQTNDKFPDMKGLCDYVHSLGLKIGTYSSPGPKTCANFEASYQHEVQDAQSYADWGMDYLKYDWCSYDGVVKGDHSLPELKKPYAEMRKALDRTNRDIVYSLCQYGMGDVWKWGAEVGGNCWRTTGDIDDNWGNVANILISQAGHEQYAGPGHWNDPDMLVVGIIGWGNPHPTRLTPNEQVLHMSMWCLLSSPLLIGCDMTRLDPLTLALLTNDEALEIDQDPLGKTGRRVSDDGKGAQVWARPLWDGTTAACLINLGDEPQNVTANWKDLGVSGSQPARDLWLHKDLGIFANGYTVSVPSHGAVLLKIGKGHR